MGTIASVQAEVHDSACANGQYLHIEDRKVVDSSIEGNSVLERKRKNGAHGMRVFFEWSDG
jgi:hypothetical protein